jgi:hypothetical protein
MPLSLRVLLLLATAFVCGVALWGGNAAHAARGGQDDTAKTPSTVETSTLPAGAERDLVRAVLALASTNQKDLVLADVVTAAVLFGRAAPPVAISHGRGVAVGAFDPAARVVIQRLFAAAAALAAPHRRRGDEPVPDLPEETLFAMAGDVRGSGDLYLRWHTATFVCECVLLADGTAQARWRDFVADAERPWLRDVLAERLRR